MRGIELAKAMVVVVNRLVSARKSSIGLDRAIETIARTLGRFDGRDVTNYLEPYKAEMLMRDISEES